MDPPIFTLGGRVQFRRSVPLEEILAVVKDKVWGTEDQRVQLFISQLVFKEDTEALALALCWDKQKTEALQQACDQELSRRLQQVQALRSLRNISKGKKKLPWGDWLSSKRKK